MNSIGLEHNYLEHEKQKKKDKRERNKKYYENKQKGKLILS